MAMAETEMEKVEEKKCSGANLEEVGTENIHTDE